MRIETKRLIIRYFSVGDETDLYNYLSKEEVVQYEPYPAYTFEQAATETMRRCEDHNFYAVVLKDGGVIGNLYLAPGEFDTWELGYVFNSEHWGKGYAGESAEALIDYAFSYWAARRITAFCNPLNRNSWVLLERLGFRREGELIKNIYFKRNEQGEQIWQDTYEYAILKEEWNQ